MGEKNTELSGLDVLEVSLVKRGANKKRFAMFKAANEGEIMQDLTAAILAIPGETVEDHPELAKEMIVKGLSKEARSTIGDAVKLLSAVKEEMSADLYKQIQNALGLKAYKGLEEEAEEKEPKGDEEAPEGGELEVSAEVKPEEEEAEKGDKEEAEKEVKKAEDPQLEALFKANQELVAKIQKHEREATEKEYVAKAEKSFKHIPGATPGAVGLLLRDLGEADAKLEERVEDILKATEAFAQNSGLLQEASAIPEGSAPGLSDAEAQLNALAKQRVKKTGESYPIAYKEVLAENASLYTQMIEGNQ